MSRREAQLRAWLSETCALPAFEMTPASGDASFRRYFRLRLADGRTLIAMDAPPDKEDCGPFVDVNARLASVGVHVPHIHAQDLARGFLLLEDLGERLYQHALDERSADRLYGEAIDALLRIQRADAGGLPPYDRDLLMREMALFPQWLLDTHLGRPPDAGEQAMLAETFEYLVENALEQPRVLVHRDYHSRNLLVCAQDSPGVIDHQDAVHGPVTYDLVSLLRDCYVSWPPERVAAWMNAWADRACAGGLLAEADRARLPRWFDLMGVQRHLKASGIFARLCHRDGKPGYLGDIPRTLGYIQSVAAHYAELAPLAELIGEQVLPRLEAA